MEISIQKQKPAKKPTLTQGIAESLDRRDLDFLKSGLLKLCLLLDSNNTLALCPKKEISVSRHTSLVNWQLMKVDSL